MSYAVESFPCGPFATNAILLSCNTTKQAVIIDPAAGSLKPIQDALSQRGFQVKAILLTHSHWDHIVDVAAMKRAFHVPVAIHPLDAPNLIHPGQDGLPLFLQIEGVNPDLQLLEGDHFSVGEIDLEVIHTPGHSAGSISLYSKEHHFLISGDLIFSGSMGRIDLPTSEAAQMWNSLGKIAKLPPQTVIYPGHGEKTTIEQEEWLLDAKKFFGG